MTECCQIKKGYRLLLLVIVLLILAEAKSWDDGSPSTRWRRGPRPGSGRSGRKRFGGTGFITFAIPGLG
ncbi:hypothetical protein GWI33_022059 [Rhynchophorus ferrugineus]|uniref:Uncharacterized protein n=1 Tax=Rhynchophorus ferrugineus TaxID=354439 RepID=A0A834IQE1_RHYFE|nr:hypothetical protein GWI33_022059 [Rhynchophorus ferrugineus]